MYNIIHFSSLSMILQVMVNTLLTTSTNLTSILDTTCAYLYYIVHIVIVP